MGKDKKIFNNITAISFNKDGSQVALCSGTKEIHIYDTNGSKNPAKWELQHTLKEHTQKATAIDWNDETGLIISGSYDRSIFVWKYNEEHNKYTPQFVSMDEKLAILDLSWNRQGTKFVVGTSSKKLYVGYWNDKHEWWSTIEIKKQHKASILSCSFSPSGKVIASASFDGTCKVISAKIDDYDDGAEETKDVFSDVTSFGECLIKFKWKFWLNHVTWSPSGNTLCYCSHDGTLNFWDVSEGKKGKITKYNHHGLPFSKGYFIDEDTFFAGGYDKAPFLFKNDGGWKLVEVLDDGYDKYVDVSAKRGDKNFFKLREIESDIKIPEKLKLKERKTKHDNTIQQLVTFKGGVDNREICTADDNGTIVFWKV